MRGDYEGLYAWLDDHDAMECGDSMAYLQYSVGNSLVEDPRTDLRSSVNIDARTRINVVFQEQSGNWEGKLITGRRKSAPWSGYGMEEALDAVDEGC